MIDSADWLGRRETAEDVCALPLVRRLAALLDRDPDAYHLGDALPQGWHMILFTPDAPQGALGVDGHPKAGGMLAPPPELPRRMLGGRRIRFLRPVTIGADMQRVSEVTRFELKQGRSGRLAVATARHTLSGASGPAVIEEQDVIFREAAGESASSASADARDTPRPDPARERTITPDPALLFRYSAITFNAHRIHYDRAYAMEEEGYPGLIVNGGLTALLLLELVKELAGRDLTHMDVRNRRPLICGRPVRLCVAPDPGLIKPSPSGRGQGEGTPPEPASPEESHPHPDPLPEGEKTGPTGPGWALWAEDDRGRMALEASAA